jgi:hypothetical protein
VIKEILNHLIGRLIPMLSLLTVFWYICYSILYQL